MEYFYVACWCVSLQCSFMFQIKNVHFISFWWDRRDILPNLTLIFSPILISINNHSFNMHHLVIFFLHLGHIGSSLKRTKIMVWQNCFKRNRDNGWLELINKCTNVFASNIFWYNGSWYLHYRSGPDLNCCDKVFSDLRQVGGFLRGLRFPPPIKLTAKI